MAAEWGAYGRIRSVEGSGTRRISPTGPIPSTGWSWSRELMACMATVRPIPVRIRSASRSTCAALARTMPPLSQYKNRTRRTPACLQTATASSGLILDGSIRSGLRHALRGLPLGLPELDQLLVGLAPPRGLRDDVDHDAGDDGHGGEPDHPGVPLGERWEARRVPRADEDEQDRQEVDDEPDRTAHVQPAHRDPSLALEALRLGALGEEDVQEQQCGRDAPHDRDARVQDVEVLVRVGLARAEDEEDEDGEDRRDHRLECDRVRRDLVPVDLADLMGQPLLHAGHEQQPPERVVVDDGDRQYDPRQHQ